MTSCLNDCSIFLLVYKNNKEPSTLSGWTLHFPALFSCLFGIFWYGRCRLWQHRWQSLSFNQKVCSTYPAFFIGYIVCSGIWNEKQCSALKPWTLAFLVTLTRSTHLHESSSAKRIDEIQRESCSRPATPPQSRPYLPKRKRKQSPINQLKVALC